MNGIQVRCVVTNSAGSVTSNAATLTVRAVGADFNGDGKPVILWQNTLTSQRHLWLIDGTTVTGGVALFTIPPEWRMAN